MQPLRFKRKIVLALDQYENLENRLNGRTRRDEGVSRHSFILWFRKQPGNQEYAYAAVDKAIDDCIEDEWIAEKPVLMSPGNPVLGIERLDRPALYVRSKGREMHSNIVFVMAVIQRLNAGQIVLYAITTAGALLIGGLGLTSLSQ